MSEHITLADLHAANIARQAEWCPDQLPDLSFRGNELAGEAGEAVEALMLHAAELGRLAGRASNLIKKLERERYGWRGSRASKEALAQELADVVICADLCAVTASIDLAGAVVDKFNATSLAQGLSTMLGRRLPFRAGDTVRHLPTGETWTVAYADPGSGRLAWCGFPNGTARLADCELVEAVDDERHRAVLAEVLACGDQRASVARRLYGEPSPPADLPTSAPPEVTR